MHANVALDDLVDTVVELLAVAIRRGDDILPAPANDTKLWTGRMQEAWRELYEAIEAVAPGKVSAACAAMIAHEQEHK